MASLEPSPQKAGPSPSNAPTTPTTSLSPEERWSRLSRTLVSNRNQIVQLLFERLELETFSPKVLGRLPNLEVLSLAENHLTEFPDFSVIVSRGTNTAAGSNNNSGLNATALSIDLSKLTASSPAPAASPTKAPAANSVGVNPNKTIVPVPLVARPAVKSINSRERLPDPSTSSLPSLYSLSVKGNLIGSFPLTPLSDSVPVLEFLDVSDNPLPPAELLRGISGMVFLELRCSYFGSCDISEEVLALSTLGFAVVNGSVAKPVVVDHARACILNCSVLRRKYTHGAHEEGTTSAERPPSHHRALTQASATSAAVLTDVLTLIEDHLDPVKRNEARLRRDARDDDGRGLLAEMLSNRYWRQVSKLVPQMTFQQLRDGTVVGRRLGGDDPNDPQAAASAPSLAHNSETSMKSTLRLQPGANPTLSLASIFEGSKEANVACWTMFQCVAAYRLKLLANAVAHAICLGAMQPLEYSARAVLERAGLPPSEGPSSFVGMPWYCIEALYANLVTARKIAPPSTVDQVDCVTLVRAAEAAGLPEDELLRASPPLAAAVRNQRQKQAEEKRALSSAAAALVVEQNYQEEQSVLRHQLFSRQRSAVRKEIEDSDRPPSRMNLTSRAATPQQLQSAAHELNISEISKVNTTLGDATTSNDNTNITAEKAQQDNDKEDDLPEVQKLMRPFPCRRTLGAGTFLTRLPRPQCNVTPLDPLAIPDPTPFQIPKRGDALRMRAPLVDVEDGDGCLINSHTSAFQVLPAQFSPSRQNHGAHITTATQKEKLDPKLNKSSLNSPLLSPTHEINQIGMQGHNLLVKEVLMDASLLVIDEHTQKEYRVLARDILQRHPKGYWEISKVRPLPLNIHKTSDSVRASGIQRRDQQKTLSLERYLQQNSVSRNSTSRLVAAALAENDGSLIETSEINAKSLKENSIARPALPIVQLKHVRAWRPEECERASTLLHIPFAALSYLFDVAEKAYAAAAGIGGSHPQSAGAAQLLVGGKKPLPPAEMAGFAYRAVTSVVWVVAPQEGIGLDDLKSLEFAVTRVVKQMAEQRQSQIDEMFLNLERDALQRGEKEEGDEEYDHLDLPSCNLDYQQQQQSQRPPTGGRPPTGKGAAGRPISAASNNNEEKVRPGSQQGRRIGSGSAKGPLPRVPSKRHGSASSTLSSLGGRESSVGSSPSSVDAISPLLTTLSPTILNERAASCPPIMYNTLCEMQKLRQAATVRNEGLREGQRERHQRQRQGAASASLRSLRHGHSMATPFSGQFLPQNVRHHLSRGRPADGDPFGLVIHPAYKQQ